MIRMNSKYKVGEEDESQEDNIDDGSLIMLASPKKKKYKHLQANWAGKILLFDQQISQISKKLLKPESQVVHLTLAGNKLQDKHSEKLADVLSSSATSLTSLDLSNNKFSGDGLATIIHAFNTMDTKKLVRLNISNSSGLKSQSSGLNQLLEELAALESLSVLVLADNNIGEEALPKVLLYIGTKAPQLNIIDIQGNIHRKGRRATRLIGGALEELALHPSIHQLNVYGNWLRLDDARYSDVLNLSASGLLHNEILLVAEIFCQSEYLQVLDLSYNGWDGDIIGEILHKLEGHPRLLELYLQGNDIHNERIIFESRFWNECELERFCIGKEILEVQDFKGTNPDALEIELEGTDLTNLDKVVLARLLETNVVLQSLNGLEIPDSDAQIDFAASPLELYEFVFLCQRILLHRHIETISFAFCNLDSKCINYLAEALREHKSLAKIDLETNRIGDPGFVSLASALQENVSLKELNLGYNEATNAGIQQICLAISLNDNLKLKSLDLKGNSFDRRTFPSLNMVLVSKCSTLERLGLGFTGITDRDIIPLFQKVDPMTFSLNYLNLAEHSLCFDGALTLTNMLKFWQVGFLDLSGCEDVHFDERAMEAIGEFMNENRLLHTLHLANVSCGDPGAKKLSEFLSTNVSLTELTLAYNNITGNGATSLADHLKENAALSVLSLESNKIADEGSMAFAQCLQMNTALTYLNLASNDIKEAGASAFLTLMEMKTYSPDFTFLRLTHNTFPDDIMTRLHELSEFPITVDCGLEDNF